MQARTLCMAQALPSGQQDSYFIKEGLTPAKTRLLTQNRDAPLLTRGSVVPEELHLQCLARLLGQSQRCGGFGVPREAVDSSPTAQERLGLGQI